MSARRPRGAAALKVVEDYNEERDAKKLPSSDAQARATVRAIVERLADDLIKLETSPTSMLVVELVPNGEGERRTVVVRCTEDLRPLAAYVRAALEKVDDDLDPVPA